VDSYTDYLQKDLYAHYGQERCFGPQHDLARGRIQERFEEFGLTTSLDPFVYNNVEYYNVVGILPGVIRPDAIYIFGAHYDSVAGSPGASDNASGVASVLEAARVLSQYRFEATIVFIAFDREEQWMVGSSSYAEEHRGDSIRGMITVVSIVYQPYPPENANSNMVNLCYDTRMPIIDELAAAMEFYAGLTCIDFKLPAPYGSDHMPFSQRGFASALVGGYAECPFYHSASDSLDTLVLHYSSSDG
jgi:Zn-dependent M28 family amino/carboxypeptidase